MATYNVILKNGKKAVQEVTINNNEIEYVRLSSDVDEPLAGLNPVDGVTPVTNDLVLCMNQLDPVFRKVYVASVGAWTEKVYTTNPKMIIVEEGTLNGEMAWLKVESETDSWDYVKIESGGGLPAGASGNTMYYNGTDWVANDQFNYSESSTDNTTNNQLELSSPITEENTNIILKSGTFACVGVGEIDTLNSSKMTNNVVQIMGDNLNKYVNLSYSQFRITNNNDNVTIRDDIITITGYSNYKSEVTKGGIVIFKPGNPTYNIPAETTALTQHNGLYSVLYTSPSHTLYKHDKNYLQAINLNDSDKQKNILISASGHVQATTYDRVRFDTNEIITGTTLIDLLELQPFFTGSVTTGFTQTYSYKVHYKLFLTFDGTGGQGGLKLNIVASNGTNVATIETPSEFSIRPEIGQFVDDHINKFVNYNSTIIETNLTNYDARSCVVEGEFWVNDYAHDDIKFTLQVAQNTAFGNFTVSLGSYMNYEVCNTDNQ